MDCAQECADQRENKGTFKIKGTILFCLDENQRTGGKMKKKIDESRHEMHSFTLTLSYSRSFVFSFFFSSSLSLGDWGFPVTWALGSPLFILSLVLHHISFSFSLTIFHLIFMSLCPWSLSLSLSLLLSFSLPPSQSSLCWVSWAYYQCVCSVFVTGQLGRKEGRLMATEMLSDSGPVHAVPMGSMCFLPLWKARHSAQHLKTDSTSTHWERVNAKCISVCV